MGLLSELVRIWDGNPSPFMLVGDTPIHLTDMLAPPPWLDAIPAGSVVAIVDDFTPGSLRAILHLIDKQATIVPLTQDTQPQHENFFKLACVTHVITNNIVRKLSPENEHPLLNQLHRQKHSGLILFSSGTTGSPKAALHDLTLFLRRYTTPRPALRTVGFLLFDHIGGLNTLFHTLYNQGTLVIPAERTLKGVLEACIRHRPELLPTTPTFLRMLLMSGELQQLPPSLKLITYGTEPMDQSTLTALCEQLPDVDFRQTYGMSELGILRISSERRDSLYMTIGGEGVAIKVVDSILYIRSENRMLGYLNHPSPFDDEGWFCTQDIIESKGKWCTIVGRRDSLINVGGLKFSPKVVEDIAVSISGVLFAKVHAKNNPITGQHGELTFQTVAENPSPLAVENLKIAIKQKLLAELPKHMQPLRITHQAVRVSHRFKRL